MPDEPWHDEPLPTADPERQRRWDRRVDAWTHGDDDEADLGGTAGPEPEGETKP